MKVGLPFLLRNLTVDGFARDRVLHEYFSELNGVLDRFDEDDDLIELKLVDQVHQLGNLLALIKLNVVLAETVEGQFAFILDQHLCGVAHELFTGCFDFTGKRGREHHNLFVNWSVLKDLLDVGSHIYRQMC